MRQLTRREKRIAASRRHINKMKQNKKAIILMVLAIVIVLGMSGFFIYEKYRPLSFKDILGSSYDEVEWIYADSKETVEDLKRYKLDRVYPGSFDATTREECKFYYKGQYVGSATFLGAGNLLIHENKIYSYNQNKRDQ